MNATEITIEGYLQKRSTGIKKSWQPRFFELGGHYLKYYTGSDKQDVRAVTDLLQLTEAAAIGEIEIHLVLVSCITYRIQK
jgi:hypothetical protein